MSADVEPTNSSAPDAVLIYATFPTAEAAETVAAALVEARLIACANILPGVTSLFIWEGRLEREQEVVVIMKTRAGLADAAVEATRRAHAYENPAIVVVAIKGGAPAFLDWIGRQTTPGGG